MIFVVDITRRTKSVLLSLYCAEVIAVEHDSAIELLDEFSRRLRFCPRPGPFRITGPPLLITGTVRQMLIFTAPSKFD